MTFLASRGVVSTVNSSTAALAGNATFTGTWEDVHNYTSITVIASADQAGTLYVEFSTDGSTVIRTVQLSDGADGAFGIHSLTVVAQYFRVRVVNGATPQGTFTLQTIYHNNGKIALPTSRLAQTLGDYSDVLNVRSAVVGKTDGGDYVNVPVTPEGHLEVAIHEPLLPYGSLHVERLTPFFQSDAVYGINTVDIRTTQGNAANPVGVTGTATADNNLYKCKTGTTAYAFATIQSRKRIPFRSGQGIVGHFSALWPAPVASSILVAGLGTGESGFYFGYNDTSFGILHSTGGVREIQTLTITTGSTSTQPYQVTLNGTTTNVTATNNGSTIKTAYEIAQGTFPGWTAMATDSTVIFVANDVGNKAGAFTLAQSGAVTPAAGTYAETKAGVASTDTWVPQASWNGDPCDGTGPSGLLLDTTKGNVFAIQVKYGFGSVNFYIENAPADGNNSTMVLVHTLRFPNSRTTPSVTQPSFPFTMAAYSAGSTTNAEIHVGNIAGFLEGERDFVGVRFSYDAQSTAVGTGAYRALLTVRNNLTFNGRANQSVINVISFGGAIEDTTPVTLYLIRNGTLAGTPNFTNVSSNSCAAKDTAATTVTVSDPGQIIQAIPLGADGNAIYTFEPSDLATIQPGETLTLAAQTVTGTAGYVLGTLNTREEH